MTKYYVTSDTHFMHKGVLRFCSETRPWANTDEMDEALIENWNSVVRRSDIVFHLGDVWIGSKTKGEEILNRLRGKIHLIAGNHDKDMVYHDQLSGGIRLKPFGKHLVQTGALASVNHYARLNLLNSTIVLSHYAMRAWDKSYHGSFMLYGHTHGKLIGQGRSMDVGIDSQDMLSNGKPFLLDDVLAFLKERQRMRNDDTPAI